MPKGEFVPIPLLCTVTFGAPLTLREAEDKAAFLERARARRCSRLPPSARRRDDRDPADPGAVRRRRRRARRRVDRRLRARAPLCRARPQRGHREPQQPHQVVVGDGDRDRRRLRLRQGRRDRAVRLRLVHGAARVRDLAVDPPRRPSGARHRLLRRASRPVLSHLDRMVRALFDLHPGLRLPAAADHRGLARRHHRLHAARRRRCNGP